MTQHSSTHAAASFNFKAASGTLWNLTTIRPLSPSVRLVRAADGTTYALKKLPISGEKGRLLLMREADAWKKASQSPAVVRLHDVHLSSDTAYFIMEYCAGGVLTAPRTERAALRSTAALTSALQFVIDNAEQRVHANISLDHVLVDASGSLKLAGFGLTRSKRVASTKRNLSERDDVRALTALLYELCYGTRFDSAEPTIPDSPQISILTRDLIRSILFVPAPKVPDLLVYRYDLAAARKLVPPCTPPLKPIVNTRPQENLELDMDSSRGLPPNSVVTENHSTSPPENDTLTSQPVVPPRVLNATQDASSDDILDLRSPRGVSEAIERIASKTLVSEGNEEANQLLEASVPMQELPDRIFEALGQLHISSSKGNPIVAFKVVTLIHRLLAEGPATLTSSALQKLDFLKWIETSWSRNRITNHTGKVHPYMYCFAAGEISWYAAMLRCRAVVHGTFAKVFSTQWMARVNGLATLQSNRRDAFRSVLDVLERCVALVRKIISAKDPAAGVKQFAIPLLMQEICKTYYALCWLFATAPITMKTLLKSELGVAHTAARNANNAIDASPEVAAQCPPEFLLNLDERAPEEFDAPALVSFLKKLKKRKKKKTVTSTTELVKESRNENSISEEVLGESETEPPGDKDVRRPNGVTGESTEIRQAKHGPIEGTQRGRTSPTRKAYRHAPVVSLEDFGKVPGIQAQNLSRPKRKSSPDVSNLRKLSISVRRGLPSDVQEPDQNGYRMGNETVDAVSNRRHRSRSRSRSPLRRRPPSHSEDENDTDSLSGTSSDASSIHDSDEDVGRAQAKPSKKSDRKKGKKKQKEKHDYETESDEDEPQRKTKAKKKNRGRSSSKDESGDEKSAEPVVKEKRVARKKHVNEKSIPFQKQHPKRKTWTKPKGTNDDEYSGGSKEALAAAASGKKTPSMNPTFEVAPYEVQFAQQIGSGGFGVVFKAKFRSQTVAVKKIHAHALMNSASIAEFQSEVAVLCTLRHPNIIGFVGACTRPPNLMIITEFMARGTLFDILHQSNERVTWPMRKKFALDTCKGMRYLHDSKLLHRDLKSSNLLLDKDFNCKVGDFGLTRISKGSAAAQMTGQCGTFQYMAVEVLANKPYSEKADVFSFGILLWEIVARKLPYFGMQPMQVGMAVLNQGLRPTIPRECPPSLAKLMRSCWDSDPSRRPSFTQLVSILEALPE
ncbi:Serine/threonine protein kinase [Gracilaria domingensis]|nr:Serine/threonine protein kinase [Gracilaria domingensis]